ncbi:MAG TPA: DUF2207 domain-containing protein [Propioniciclava tarda]|nr:DUF2207 domain-containing protein [Propioniciclava tarda]
MAPVELGLLTLAVLAWIAVGVVAVVAKAFHRDEVFTNAIPGTIPRDASTAPRHRVQGVSQEYDGEIPVSFSPPRGLTPGLVGTVVDGSVDSRDLTATLIDLARRGHLSIEAVPGSGEPSKAMKDYARRPVDEERKTDWLLKRADEPPADHLSPLEHDLLKGLFHGNDRMRMGNLDQPALQALREAQVGLYREVVEYGWYRKHPQAKGGAGCLLIGLGVVLAGLFIAVKQTWPVFIAAALVVGAFIVLSRALRGRTPRTAEGSAVRIQALGFKKYLATAEAEQFKFEEAAGLFSRYLPYAMVFGVAQHWAKVFGDVARNAQASGWTGDLTPDLLWFDGPGVDFSDLLFWDSLDGDLDLFGAADGLVELGGGAVEGLGDVATQLGDFMGSLDFLDGLGDGCDVGGCGDVGGCIDF